jgi:hypothetical protein
MDDLRSDGSSLILIVGGDVNAPTFTGYVLDS